MLLGGSRLRGNDGGYTGGCHRPLTQFLSQSAGYNRMTAHHWRLSGLVMLCVRFLSLSDISKTQL
jgi:hypothetical protein